MRTIYIFVKPFKHALEPSGEGSGGVISWGVNEQLDEIVIRELKLDIKDMLERGIVREWQGT